MNCPDCGAELERRREKVPLPLTYSSPERKARLKGTSQMRSVYVCESCGSKWILTPRLVKIE